MKICKAKVINVGFDTYWYKHLLGKDVYVTKENRPCDRFEYKMIFLGEFDGLPGSSYFHKSDIEIIEEFDGDIKSKFITSIIKYINA